MAIGRPLELTANVASKSINVLATEGQTSFTVQGGYRINEIAVYRNGTRLAEGRDYTATDGSTVTLLAAAIADDVIAYQIFDSFNIADAIQSDASDQTINGNLSITGTLKGGSVGVASAGTLIGTAQTINFIGTGNTVVTNGNTIDVSISGGGGGGGIGTAINYSDGTSSPFSYIDPDVTVGEDMLLDDTSAGTSDTYIVSVIPNITVASGVAITVGSGKTMIVDVLQIGDL